MEKDKVTTGLIRALPDDAPEPDGYLLASERTVKFIVKWICKYYRIVWFRGKFYAVEKSNA